MLTNKFVKGVFVVRYFSQLYRGDFGLAKTYWIWGFAGSAVWAMAMGLLITDERAGAPTPLLAAFLAYLAVVLVGVWNSARKYTGPVKWKRSAMMLTIMGTVIWVGLVVAVLTR